jgi:hypothetical protein
MERVRERVRVMLSHQVVEDDLTILADKHDWWIKRRIAQNGNQPAEYIYCDDPGTTNIHYIQDHKIGVKYILVKGPAAEQIAMILTENLRHYDANDIREGARNEMSAEDRRSSLYFLALISMDHGFNDEVFEIYKRYLKDSDPFVRGSALLGSAYLGWPELTDSIQELAGLDESDESIRRDAALLLERLLLLKPKRDEPS